MPFSFGTYSSLLLVGVVPGMVISTIALLEGIRNRLRSSVLLGSLLFTLCLYVAPFMLGYAGWYGEDGYREALFYIPCQQLLLIGPLAYLYTNSVLWPGRQFNRRDLYHMIPALMYILYSLVMFLFDGIILEEPYFYADGRDRDFDLWYQIAGYVSMVYYFGLSLRAYKNYRKEIFEQLSYAHEITFVWIRHFLSIFLIVLILRLLFFLLNPEWGEFGAKFWYYLAIATIIFYLSISGFRHAVTSYVLDDLGLRAVRKNPEVVPGQESYSFEMEEIDAGIQQIDKLMAEKRLYEEPLLTLADIAAELDTNSKKVSAIINKGKGMNFNDYVNSFRIEAVIERFQRQEHQELTLLGIALSCGFNSKSTFNRVFKKLRGVTPSEFIKETGAKS